MSGSRYDDGGWRREAACLGREDSDLFFPLGTVGQYRQQNRVAKSICRDCPVKLDCLQFALATNQQFGIWGGLNEDERRDIRRQWRRGVPLEDEIKRRTAIAVS